MDIDSLSAKEKQEVEDQWEILFAMFEWMLESGIKSPLVAKLIEIRIKYSLAEFDEIEWLKDYKAQGY